MATVNEVHIAGMTVGTVAITDWADKHPDVRFNATFFRCDNPRDSLIVSEDEPSASVLAAYHDQWHDLPNGWQRVTGNGPMWTCRKKCGNGYRYIFITT